MTTTLDLNILFYIMDKADEPQDLYALSQTSWHFFIALKQWLISNTEKMMSRNGIQDPLRLMDSLLQTNSIVSGPECLAVWYPLIPPTGRLEIFAAKPVDGNPPAIIDHLTKVEKFSISKVDPIGKPEGGIFSKVYGDMEFGRTVSQVISLTKKATKKEPGGKCIVIVSKSHDTPLVTITELPSTLFMNCVDGISAVSLYPLYTFQGVGLMNYDGPVQASSITSTQPFHSLGFKFLTQLDSKIASHHNCGHHHLCPHTIRNTVSGKLGWTNIRNPYGTKFGEGDHMKRFMIWRLRCAGMCGDTVPEPELMEALLIVYTTQTFHYGKHSPASGKKDDTDNKTVGH